MKFPMTSKSAAMSLRESFGDRKIPDISRKITACVSCRKLKIKCHMTNNKPPCTRCRSRGTNCTLNKSLQTLLEGDASWKEEMEERMNALERLFHTKTQNIPDPPASSYQSQRFLNGEEHGNSRIETGVIEPSHPVALDLSCSLGGFPASSMTSFGSKSAITNSVPGADLVSVQLIPTETLDGLFNYYKENMDSNIHHILTNTDTFGSIRRRSTILASAICTVAAFSSGSKYYENLVKAFKIEVSGKLFSDFYTFDDVRALCLGALWLHDVSNSLNGLAVRIATDLDLHRCLSKMPHVKRECYDRTRLYLLVYLCDHQCSLGRGKPPLTRDFQELKSPREFLDSEFSDESDLQLISQVELWSISSRVFGLFGADVDNCPSNDRLAEIPQFAKAYENWYHEWSNLLPISNNQDPSLRTIFDHYYHSAKLYLFSHSFRGRSSQNSEPPGDSFINVGLLEHHAFENALSMICDVGNQRAVCLEQLPYYFGAVTTFASVCLVKAVGQGRSIICEKDGSDIKDHLRNLATNFRSSSSRMTNDPLCGIADTLEAALHGVSQPDGIDHLDMGWSGVFGFDFTFEGPDMCSHDSTHVGCDIIDPNALSLN